MCVSPPSKPKTVEPPAPAEQVKPMQMQSATDETLNKLKIGTRRLQVPLGSNLTIGNTLTSTLGG